MKKIMSLGLVLGLVASFAAAGEGDECPSKCKGADGKATALSAARKAFADVPKAEEKLTADQREQLKGAREVLMATPFGKAMGPSFEACGWLTLAASAQPGTSPEAAAVLKDVGATYCTIAKIFGSCQGCEGCEKAGECCKECKEMTPETLAAKANESADIANKALAAAIADAPNTTPEQMEKINAAMATMKEFCPCMPAMKGATEAINEAYASLAKMGVPSTDAKNATRDELVKSALALHGQLTACSSCEECEECEKTEEAAAPAKSS